jgi:hypothetical protein
MRPGHISICCLMLLAGVPNFAAAQGSPAEAKKDKAGAQAATAQQASPNAAPAPRAATNPAAPEIKIKVDAELTAAQLQMVDQLRPLMKTELDFAARACRLTDGQRKQLAEEGEENLRELVTGNGGAVLLQRGANAMQRVVIREGNRTRVVTMSASSRAQFGSQVAAIVHANFPGEVEARYQKECAERSAFQKRAVIDNTIVVIDKQLMLTDEQSKQIGEALAKAWNDLNLPDLQMLVSSNGYIPQIPDSCVTPYLRPAQKAVWQTRNLQTTVGGPFAVPALQLNQF